MQSTTDIKTPKMGRPTKATPEQIETMCAAFNTVKRNSPEYRALRLEFASNLRCTERAIEQMVDRHKKETDAGETASVQSLPVAGGGEEPEHTQPQGDNQNGKA